MGPYQFSSFLGDAGADSQRVRELEIELARSQKEIVRMNRNWEKRFSVLRKRYIFKKPFFDTIFTHNLRT